MTRPLLSILNKVIINQEASSHLSCSHQIPFVNIFPSHGLYISNMVSEPN